MIKILKMVVAIINELHDILTNVFDGFGLQFTDKHLHFIVIGFVGMFVYLVVNYLFKAISKYSISILSFIYTLTVLVVIVFGIELEQKITNSGNMEFADIVAGLWGFTAFFIAYIIIYCCILLIKKYIKRYSEKRSLYH